MRPLRLDHCVIAVSDWERSNAFYRDVLGAEIIQRDEWFGSYVFGDWHVAIDHLRRRGFAIEAGRRTADGPAAG